MMKKLWSRFCRDREEIEAALGLMRANVKTAGAGSIGLTIYPPYPEGTFKNPAMGPWSYQNGGDWDWFGGRMIQAWVAHGFILTIVFTWPY